MADPESERSHLAFQSYYQGQARRHFGRVRSCIRAQTLPWLVHAQTYHGWEDSEISKDPGRKSWYGFWGSAQDAKNAEQKWTGDYLLQFDVSSFKFIYLCYALLCSDMIIKFVTPFLDILSATTLSTTNKFNKWKKKWRSSRKSSIKWSSMTRLSSSNLKI